ncbi:MAG: metallophosphoesterase [Bacteroidia bacterium]
MSRSIPFLAVVIILMLLIDIYVFQALRTVTNESSLFTRRIVYTAFWTLTTLSLSVILAALLTDFTSWPKLYRTYLPALVLVLYISKIPALLFIFTDDLWRGMQWVVHLFYEGTERIQQGDIAGPKISRSQFLNIAALMASGFLFSTFFYGMVRGAYDFRVKRIKIRLPNLPGNFDGMKIVQISDIHTGSFTTNNPLEKAVKLINRQKADMVFFTGDLVNNVSQEAERFKSTLSGVQADEGIYSILGNHDYGDYAQWPSEKEKHENLERMKAIHREMGWTLLLDENRIVTRAGEKMAVLGVQNWSANTRFRKYGNLATAHAGTEDIPFKLLLSHDPSHWGAEVTEKYHDIDVTFSGHTHGMQFGIDIPGLKWSPVQYVYKQWSGLYEKGRQMLYVNRGLGFLGYPGRVGMWPEITVFEFSRG